MPNGTKQILEREMLLLQNNFPKDINGSASRDELGLKFWKYESDSIVRTIHVLIIIHLVRLFKFLHVISLFKLRQRIEVLMITKLKGS